MSSRRIPEAQRERLENIATYRAVRKERKMAKKQQSSTLSVSPPSQPVQEVKVDNSTGLNPLKRKSTEEPEDLDTKDGQHTPKKLKVVASEEGKTLKRKFSEVDKEEEESELEEGEIRESPPKEAKLKETRANEGALISPSSNKENFGEGVDEAAEEMPKVYSFSDLTRVSKILYKKRLTEEKRFELEQYQMERRVEKKNTERRKLVKAAVLGKGVKPVKSDKKVSKDRVTKSKAPTKRRKTTLIAKVVIHTSPPPSPPGSPESVPKPQPQQVPSKLLKTTILTAKKSSNSAPVSTREAVVSVSGVEKIAVAKKSGEPEQAKDSPRKVDKKEDRPRPLRGKNPPAYRGTARQRRIPKPADELDY